MRRLTIAGKELTQTSVPYVIAELGTNHGGNVDTCLKMVRVAADCGASAVKLQKRTNSKLFTRNLYNQPYNSDAAYGPTYGLHREALELPMSAYREARELAHSLGMDFIATAFDFDALDFILDARVDAVKIASGDLTNIPLQQEAARSGLPVLVSCGGGTLDDIDRVVVEWAGAEDKLCLLHCTAEYPCPPEDMDLKVIETMMDAYPGVLIGISDHQNGIALAIMAYTYGAVVHEKHFTLDRSARGTDHAFSLEPTGLKKLVRDLGRAHAAVGDGVKDVKPGEAKPLFKMGKKIVAVKPLSSGIVVDDSHITFKSPGDGLPPYKKDEIIGKYLTSPVEEDDNIERGWEE